MPGYCYKYLRQFATFNSLLGLPFFVKWHLFSNTSTTIKYLGISYQKMTEVIEVLGFLSCLIAPPQVWHNIDLLCACLSPLMHSFQIVLKTFHLKFKCAMFNKHLEEFDLILQRNEQLNTMNKLRIDDYFQSDSRYIRILQVIHFIIKFSMTTLYFVPFIADLFTDLENLTLPVVGYFPFDVSHSTGYRIAFAMQVAFFYLFNLKMIVMDYFIMAFIVLHTSQMRFMKDTLIQIIHNEKNAKDQHESNKLLLIWIKQHQDSYRASLALKPLLSSYIAVEYFYVIVHTCLPAFVITSTMSWSLFQKTALLVMVSGGLLILYMLSEAGNALSSISGDLNEVLYGTHLIRWKTARTTFFMHKQLKPFYIRVGTLFPLCFVTFMSILRAIFTYYMALNEIQHIKEEAAQ